MNQYYRQSENYSLLKNELITVQNNCLHLQTCPADFDGMKVFSQKDRDMSIFWKIWLYTQKEKKNNGKQVC